MAAKTYVLGIDIGTSGVKVLAVGEDGQVAAQGAASLPAPEAQGNRREQDAELWWVQTQTALRATLADLRENGGQASQISAIAVDATSGTIVPVDAALRPIRPGMMYNDGRSSDQASRLNRIGRETLARLGYRFSASFALAKILWLYENEPESIAKAETILHQADFITARLTGGLQVTDESNALKTGYDILERRWPDYLDQTAVDTKLLPSVIGIGDPLGAVGPKAIEDFGFSPSCRVVGGMSDGTAASVASGARRSGDGNTTLGTTVVWKIVTGEIVCDPEGRLYSHRHPSGGFLPGGAGNSGGEGIRHLFEGGADPGINDRLQTFASQLRDVPPTGTLTYPLPGPGERFPFVDPQFAPFTTAGGGDSVALYRSALEGIACIERWGYEVGAALGAPCEGEVWTTGKGAELDAWMQIRADFLNRPVSRAACPQSAYGSALVAAMNVWFDGSWQEAANNLVHPAYRCEPRRKYRQACDDQYGLFREACAARR